MQHIEPLNVPGARQQVEIENPRGILYKIRIGGEVARRQRGSWRVPARNGKEIGIKAKGLIPGFQTLYVDDEPIYDMGGGVGRVERIVMFAPMLLILWPFGIVIGFVLFLLGIPAVKNLLMPRALRIILPIVNLVAGAFVLTLITQHLTFWG